MLHAVDDISFSIEKGRTLGLVGESGCGKSTTGRAILRLEEPTSGQVLFNGQDILALNKKEMRKNRVEMQIIFQDPFSSLNPRKNISQTIEEALIRAGRIHNKTEMQGKISELMETVGLAERLKNTYPHELDGGRRQRGGIARALAMEPTFIVCDEPVSALDVSVRAQVLNLMKDLQKEFNLTYMFISHDLSVVRFLCDRIGVMYLGRMVEIADRQELYDNPMHPYTKALLSAIPVPDVDVKHEPMLLEGDIPSPYNPPKGCLFHTRCKFAMECCKTEVPQMRQIGENHCVACHLYDDVK